MTLIKNLFKKSQINEEVDQAKYSKLSALFLKNPKKAIEKSEKYLIKSTKLKYPQYIEKVKSTQKSNMCIVSWNTDTLCGQCFDCQVQGNTCFCIKCYIEGHHDQHNSVVKYFQRGCCDCGNPSFIQTGKFCPHHPGPDPNPDLTQMTQEDRQKFITIFKAAFYAIITTDSPSILHSCLEYISEFIPLGDGLRRCAAYAVVSLSKKELYESIPKMTEEMVGELIDFFGKIISDLSFLDKMTYYYFINGLNLDRALIDAIKRKQTKENVYLALAQYNNFTFHFFNERQCEFIINNSKVNWADFLVEYFRQIIETILASGFDYDTTFDSHMFNRLYFIPRFLKGLMKYPENHGKLQEYIDKFSKCLARSEGLFGFTIRLTPQDDNDFGYLLYDMSDGLAKMVQQFGKSNKTAHPSNLLYSIDAIVKSLNDFLEKKKPTAASILNSQLNTEIEPFIPLHLLFSYVLTNFSDPKSEIEKVCLNQKIDFEEFCLKASIFPLRLLASIYHQGKFIHSNNSIREYMKHVIESPKVLFNPCFRLVQLLLSICGNKEKFIENAFITFGLFDDVDYFKKTMDKANAERQIFLSQYSYLQTGIFVLSLMTDRSIITLDTIAFNRLQVIELLLRKSSSAVEIENHIEERLNDPIVADSLLDYIERFSTKKGSRFRVKNKGDFTPFFPPISSDSRINMMLKYSGKLVPLLDYVDLPNNLSFNEVFRLPSFIAITFALLSAKNPDVPTTQVGLLLFVSMVRNGDSFPPASFDKPNPISIKGRSLHDVLSAIEKVSDKLSKVNILTIPIQIGDEPPVSLLQLVQAKKELGSLALERANLPSSLYRKEDKENQERIQACKAKAELLKQRLMKEFQNRQRKFGAAEESVPPKAEKNGEEESSQEPDEEGENDNNDEFDKYGGFDDTKILCSVCLTEMDDIIGFPCLSLPSNLSFIVEAKLNRAAIDCLNYDLMPDSFTMSICGHHMHYQCFVRHLKDALDEKERNGYDGPRNLDHYRCPIDRRIRNCFLPLFPHMPNISEKFSIEPPIIMRVSITDFLNRAYFGKAAANLNVPIQSFASMITLLEVRHRSRPDCLDSPDVPALLHNLLLTIYHGIHASLLGRELNSASDPLFELVFRTICSYSPLTEFASIVQRIAGRLKNEKLFQFLRRAAIIDEFALKDRSKRTVFVDWDDVFSFGCLIERFAVNADMKEIALPIIDSIKLPDRFISLCQPPFNIEIFDSSAIRAIDLLTGKIVCIIPNKDNYNEREYRIDVNYDLMINHVRKCYKGGVGLLMFLTGPNSTSLLFYSSLLDNLWIRDSFYTDQFGDSDPGFTRGIITKLSKDKLESALDLLLSGELP